MKTKDELIDLIDRMANSLMEVTAHVIIDKASALPVASALQLIDEANQVIINHGKTH
jgi:hypothetical protein